MKRVEHHEVEAGMRLKIDGRWVNVHAVRRDTFPETLSVLTCTYHMGDGKPVTYNLTSGASWELHPQRAAKRVQHDEVKPGMVIKLAHHGGSHGRWVTVEHVYGYKLSSPSQEASAQVRAYYTNAQKRERFGLTLYALEEGYRLHPQSEMLAAKEVQRAGRGDVRNLVLREYSIKLALVDRVDNQGEPCDYCSGANTIISNIYATVHNDAGRTEESAWSTCATCEIHSVDEVEDVDQTYTVTIERAWR